jgi:hypothetical protein
MRRREGRRRKVKGFEQGELGMGWREGRTGTRMRR